MPVFLWHRASFWHRNTHVLRKRRVPKLQKAVLFAIVAKTAKSCAFCDSLPVFCGTELLPVHRAFSLGAQSSSPRHRAFTLRHTRLITPATSKPPHDTQSFFPPVHRAFSLRCTELFPTDTQSFVLAAFATLVCQRNCVFLCKGTKLKNPACAEFLG